MNRAELIGERINKVSGGGSQPVYLSKTIYVGADSSRGVRGTAIETLVELEPRPIVEPVSGELITKQMGLLRAGDFKTDIHGSQIVEEDLVSKSIRVRVGNSYFTVINYEPVHVSGHLAYATVFLRGVE